MRRRTSVLTLPRLSGGRQVVWQIGLTTACAVVFSGPLRAADLSPWTPTATVVSASRTPVSPRQRTAAALNALHSWLGGSSQGPSWRSYLRSDDLLVQLQLGDRANPAALREILERYESGSPGLQGDRFRAVRDALRSWLSDGDASPWARVVEQLRAAAAEYRPITDQEVQGAAETLTASVAAADRWLQAQPSAKQGELRKALAWDELQEAVGGPELPDSKRITKWYGRVPPGTAGLEQSEVQDVRRAARSYLNAIAFQSAAAEKFYQARVDRLMKAVEAFAAAPAQKQSEEIGRLLGIFKQMRQSKPVFDSIRRRFNRPNLFGRVSERVVSAGMEDHVDRTSPIRQTILGTAIRGNARTQGAVFASLVPNDGQAAVQLQLRGQANSRNVGFNRGVRIHSTGVTNIDARKMLYLDGDGIRDYPANADCDTHTRIGCIGAKCGIVRRIARKKAEQSRGAAQRQASRLAEDRVANRMDDQAEELVADSNQRFEERVLVPLRRQDAYPQLFQVRSTARNVLVRVLTSNDDQVGASTAPPTMPGSPDLAMRIHESAVRNFGEMMLAGRTLTDKEVREMYKENDWPLPTALAEGEIPWSITFSATAPIRVEFDEDGIIVIISGRKFTRWDGGGLDEIDVAAKIAARYRFVRTPQGAVLRRDAKITVTPAKRDVRAKVLLEKRGEELFPSEYDLEGWELPGRWKRAGKFALEHWFTGDGWLAGSWVQGWKPPPLKTAQK